MNPVVDVAVAVIVESERLLVTRRKEEVHLGGLWEFPGGKRNRGETMEACLLREVEEELGVAVEIDRLLWRKSHPYSDRTVVLYAYLCHLLSGNLRPLASQECRWIGPESLLSLPFPEANRPFLERLASEIGEIGSNRHENQQK